MSKLFTIIFSLSFACANLAHSELSEKVLCALGENPEQSECYAIDFVFDPEQQHLITICPQNSNYFRKNSGSYSYLNEVWHQNRDFCSSLPKSEDINDNIQLRRDHDYDGSNPCIFKELCDDFIYARLVKFTKPRAVSDEECMYQFENGLYGFSSCRKRNNELLVDYRTADVNPYINFQNQLGRPLYQGSDFEIVGFIHHGITFPSNNVPFEKECKTLFKQTNGIRSIHLRPNVSWDKFKFDPNEAIAIYAPSEKQKFNPTRVCPWVFGGQEYGVCSPEGFFNREIYDVNIKDFIKSKPKIFDRYLTFSSENGYCNEVYFDAKWDSFDEEGYITIEYSIELPFMRTTIHDWYQLSKGSSNLTPWRWYGFDNDLKELQFKFLGSDKEIRKIKVPNVEDWNVKQHAHDFFTDISNIYTDNCAKGFIVRRINSSGDKIDTTVSGCRQEVIFDLKDFAWLNEGLYFSNVKIP